MRVHEMQRGSREHALGAGPDEGAVRPRVDPHPDSRSATHQVGERVEGRVGERFGARLEVGRVVRVAATADLHDEVADVPADAVREELLDRLARRDPVAHHPQGLRQHQARSA